MNTKKNKKRPWLIIVAGAPGSGKSALSAALAEKLNGFAFEIGTLRQIHLNRLWSSTSAKEERMTFENYVAMLKNYRAHRLGPVIANDLPDTRISDLLGEFSSAERLLVTLTVSDPDVHKRRILDPKADRGFRRYDAAAAWNAKVISRALVPGELRLATDQMGVAEELGLILRAIKDPRFLIKQKTGHTKASKNAYFDLHAYFKKNPIPPWGNKIVRHVNEGWENASTGRDLWQSRLGVDGEQIAALCRELGVKRLALFGSVLTDRFNANSDVDLLVEFLPGAVRTLFDKGNVQMKFESMFGRKVDLAELRLIDNPAHRMEILANRREIYVAS